MILRLMHAAAIAALIGSAAYVYGVKYRTIYAAEQLVKTRHLIAKEKDAINLLRAEYAHLARPDRIQELADAKLGMQPLALAQIATVGELPDAQPKIDSIGRTLEQLGFNKDNETPAAGGRRRHPGGEVSMAKIADERQPQGQPTAARTGTDRPGRSGALPPPRPAELRRRSRAGLARPPADVAALAADGRQSQGVRPRSAADTARPIRAAHPHRRARHGRRLRGHRREAGRARRLPRPAADPQGGRRSGRLRRPAGPPRPQRRDSRHRRQDHVGVRRAEPDRRQGRGGRTHHRRPAGRRRQGAARAARLEEGLRLGQAPDHAEGAGGDLPSRPAGRRLPAGEQARLPQRADRRPCPRLCRQGQCRHRRHGEVSRSAEPDRPACAGFLRRSGEPEAGAAVARRQGHARACGTS